MEMRTGVVWALGVVVIAGVAILGVFARAQGEDFKETDSLSEGDVQHAIVISLPFERRLTESIEPEGHQAWRSDVRTSAMMELLAFVRTMNGSAAEEEETCQVVSKGLDSAGRPTAIVEKDLPSGCWEFQRARATIHLFQNEGDVWITTKIVIQEQPTSSSGR